MFTSFQEVSSARELRRGGFTQNGYPCNVFLKLSISSISIFFILFVINFVWCTICNFIRSRKEL